MTKGEIKLYILNLFDYIGKKYLLTEDILCYDDIKIDFASGEVYAYKYNMYSESFDFGTSIPIDRYVKELKKLGEKFVDLKENKTIAVKEFLVYTSTNIEDVYGNYEILFDDIEILIKLRSKKISTNFNILIKTEVKDRIWISPNNRTIEVSYNLFINKMVQNSFLDVIRNTIILCDIEDLLDRKKSYLISKAFMRKIKISSIFDDE
jgi:hypothetical protein